ncbi:probable glutamate receptor isoform X2 [Macrobrachium nipponense]
MVSWPTHTQLRLEDMNSAVVLAGIPTNFPIAGPMSYVLEILSTTLNFTYKQVVPPDVSWGVRSPNGTWSGMVRQVLEKEVDMALGPFQVIESRNQVIDFSTPFFFDTLSFMVARGSDKIDPWGFLMPFNPNVWGAFFLCLLAICLAHFACDLTQNPPTNLAHRFGSVVMDYIRPPMNQAIRKKVTKNWHRPLLGSWTILALLLNFSYEGNLRSLMALRYIPHPIQTVRDAIEATNRKLIIEHRTSFTDILGRIPSGDLRNLDDQGKAGRYVDLKMRDFMSYYPLVRDKGSIQIFDVTTSLLYFSEYFSMTGRCDFYIAKEKFIPTMYAMVNQKNSPLTPAINARIRRIVESGLYNYWVFRNSNNITACANPPMTIVLMDPIGIGSIWGLAVIWTAGMTVAAIAFTGEMAVAWLNRDSRSEDTK